MIRIKVLPEGAAGSKSAGFADGHRLAAVIVQYSDCHTQASCCPSTTAEQMEATCPCLTPWQKSGATHEAQSSASILTGNIRGCSLEDTNTLAVPCKSGPGWTSKPSMTSLWLEDAVCYTKSWLLQHNWTGNLIPVPHR
jgi:hypothetical protein